MGRGVGSIVKGIVGRLVGTLEGLLVGSTVGGNMGGSVGGFIVASLGGNVGKRSGTLTVGAILISPVGTREGPLDGDSVIPNGGAAFAVGAGVGAPVGTPGQPVGIQVHDVEKQLQRIAG